MTKIISAIQYVTLQEEFNVDWKAECGQLYLAQVARNKQM